MPVQALHHNGDLLSSLGQGFDCLLSIFGDAIGGVLGKPELVAVLAGVMEVFKIRAKRASSVENIDEIVLERDANEGRRLFKRRGVDLNVLMLPSSLDEEDKTGEFGFDVDATIDPSYQRKAGRTVGRHAGGYSEEQRGVHHEVEEVTAEEAPHVIMAEDATQQVGPLHPDVGPLHAHRTTAPVTLSPLIF